MSTAFPPAAGAGTPPRPEAFPRTFWTANVTELFERGAYYSMASFVVIYLGQLGMGDYWPSILNSLLWGLIYFLPILSGTIADQVGFKRALVLAFVLLGIGYAFMGAPVWLGGAELGTTVLPQVTAPGPVFGMVLAGIVLIGIGGSFVKPCISGTVQKTAGRRATLAFAIFYMIINIGSLFGRGVGYVARTNFGLSAIFAVALSCAVVALLIVLVVYADPDRGEGAKPVAGPRRSPGRILLDMVLVLKNGRFAMFLLVSSGFNFLYSQVYNVLPLYLKRVVETNPAVDLYTMANPFVIVFFQLLITRAFGTMKPVRSMIVGIVIISLSMVVNVVPIFLAGGVRATLWDLLPVGSMVIILTVAMIAFGELFTSARTYEYIGALAPKGQEGLFLGYANLPIAIGAIVGGPVGAFIFNEIMAKDAVKLDNGLLELVPANAATGWLILMGVGLASAVSMVMYNRWIEKHPA
jgi:dipeptide/tripeptide permease